MTLVIAYLLTASLSALQDTNYATLDPVIGCWSLGPGGVAL